LYPDIQIGSVLSSEDVDLFPTDYRESMFIVMHEHLGFESEFKRVKEIAIDKGRWPLEHECAAARPSSGGR
jgi:hypothetical protein